MSTSLFDLNGKVALVTGAAQGLGRAMALVLGRGVRVNAILPAQVLNPSLEERIAADPGFKT